MISLRALHKQFPGTATAALHDVSLEIESGEFFTLFGPSGCGKSTLLRCLAGLETPDGGEIAIGGTEVFSSRNGIFAPPNQRRIGMVFQSYAIWPHMTVLENVAFPLEVRKQPRVLERARAALDTVGLSALEDRYASMLSGGQQQRVALARAIVADPAVLLLDEPLSNLDAALRDQMRAELQSLQKRIQLTTVYVTHDQTEALSMSDRIAVMREGRIVEAGSPNDLYYRPGVAFTARLIGGANVLEGTAVQDGDGTWVDTALGRLRSAHRANGPVEVFIRPDKVVPADEPGTNVLDCRVRERRFAGETTELDLVRADERYLLRCRLPTAVAPGEHLRVRIDPADVRIFRCG
jgi:ABC-type Fe3+/spermidine/putrescine transport system ATPase subunit